MSKPAVKPVSSSPGLTFEEFRELVGKLRNVSDILARELTNHSGSKKAEKLSRECDDLSVAIVGFWGQGASSSLKSLVRSDIGLIQEESC